MFLKTRRFKNLSMSGIKVKVEFLTLGNERKSPDFVLLATKQQNFAILLCTYASIKIYLGGRGT